MRFLFFFIIFISFSCNPKKFNEAENHDYNISTTDKIKYYKCNYSAKDSIVTILSSGPVNNSLSEYWSVNPDEITSSDSSSLGIINVNRLIRVGKEHLSSRLQHSDLQFSEISIEKVPLDSYNKIIFICIITYKKSENFIEKIPMLLDGTVILSSNEI